MVKIYKGGSTGLVQQKSKTYPAKQKPSEYIYPFIKEQIKGKYNIDLVLMAEKSQKLSIRQGLSIEIVDMLIILIITVKSNTRVDSPMYNTQTVEGVRV